MNSNITQMAEAVRRMDEHLRTELFIKDGKVQAKKLWEHTFIKHQIDKRNQGGVFTVSDHIRAMVYSMLTSGASWNRVEPNTDIDTGRIPLIDEIFCQYDVNALLNADPAALVNKVKEHRLGTQYIKNQINALVSVNIGNLLSLEKEYGSVDNFYKILVCKDDNLKNLVRELSTLGKPHKFAQLGEALTAEYLKNVGYDIGKPDRHICRILGSDRLGCFTHKTVLPYEAIDIIAAIAKSINKPAAEVDYILWAYCANGFGEICTKNKPKCDVCSVTYCNQKE